MGNVQAIDLSRICTNIGMTIPPTAYSESSQSILGNNGQIEESIHLSENGEIPKSNINGTIEAATEAVKSEGANAQEEVQAKKDAQATKSGIITGTSLAAMAVTTLTTALKVSNPAILLLTLAASYLLGHYIGKQAG